ncbi:MAG: ABC transporter permease [Myxococcales bacterium]|nr:ABC transporter permease [Polyangiaceae bacterium]MDW8249406.1 ABC transporter permease [Myxococcales bacterium]
MSDLPTGNPHLALLAYAFGSLRRRMRRTLAIAFGLCAAVTLLSAVLFLTDALQAEAAQERRFAPDLVVQRLVGGRPALVPTDWQARIEGRPGVAKVTPRVWGYLFLPSLQGNVTVVGFSPRGEALPPLLVTEGHLPSTSEPESCALGRGLARALGVRAGDRVRFPGPGDRGPSCIVTGVFSSEVDLFTSDVVLVREEAARRLLALPDGEVTDLAVDLTTPDESRVLAAVLTESLPGSRVLEKRLLERVHRLSFGRRSGLVLGASLPALLVLLVLAQDRSAGLSTPERREIAVLKASGWSSSDVLEAKLYEAVLVALASTALGMSLGFLWIFVLGAPGLREVLAGWSTLYPALHLTPQITLGQLLSVQALVAGPFVALSVVPAWRAATLDPMEIMREGE